MFWLCVLGAAMAGFCLGVLVAGWSNAHDPRVCARCGVEPDWAEPYVDRSPL